MFWKRYAGFLIVFMGLLHSTAVAEGLCAGPLTEAEYNPFDPTSPRLVLLAGGLSPAKSIHNQIKLSLPEGVESRVLSRAASAWIRDWLPLLVKDAASGEWKFVEFIPLTPHGQRAAQQVGKVLRRGGVPVEKVEVYLDWGNTVSDGRRVFISRSLPMVSANREHGISMDQVKTRIESALNMPVTWLPSLPREGTGHADMFVSYVGSGRFVVADSRELARKDALDQTTEILEELGYDVTRIRNASHDRGEDAYSYTNALIVGNRVLLPVYGEYVRRYVGLTPVSRGLWRFFNSIVRHPRGEQVLRQDEALKQSVLEDDKAAIEAYQRLGFEVYPISMNNVVDYNGMVHCLTRCLPNELVEKMPAPMWK